MRVRAVILAALAAAGCYRDAPPVPPGAHADIGPPPADCADAPPARAGMVWIPGRWARSGDRWVWLEGYFEAPRPGYRYEPGRWVVAPAAAAGSAAAVVVEWASTVRDVSSQYGSDQWSAQQALGAPNVFPADGDNAEAWASLTADGQAEFIEVGYDRPMRASGVDIYETFNPGAVNGVELIGEGGTHQMAVSGNGSQPLRVRFGCTSDRIVAVRIEVDSATVAGWNEIDAIGLVPCE